MLLATLTFALVTAAAANDNGLAITPPQGWRSWNLYGRNVNQTLIESIMTGMETKGPRPVPQIDGSAAKMMSLKDLGYDDVGLDDYWQACSATGGHGDRKPAPGMNYHDVEGKPIVNLLRFPDMKKMTAHAHGLGLTR